MWKVLAAWISARLRSWADRLAPRRALPWHRAAAHYRIAMQVQTKAFLQLSLVHEKQKRLLLWVLTQLTNEELDHVQRGESWATPTKKTNSPGGTA